MVEYAIYENKEDLIFIGDVHKCSKFLNCSEDSFYCRYSRFSRGIVKNPKFKIYKIEE